MPRKIVRKPPKRSAPSKAGPKQGGRDREAEYASFLKAAREAEAVNDPKNLDTAFRTEPKKPA